MNNENGFFSNTSKTLIEYLKKQNRIFRIGFCQFANRMLRLFRFIYNNYHGVRMYVLRAKHYYIVLSYMCSCMCTSSPSSHINSNSMHASCIYYCRRLGSLTSSYSRVATTIPVVKQKVARPHVCI